MQNEASGSPAPSGRTDGLAIALAGMVALAVAMGIGRFAFTPLLPMMLDDGVIDLPGASWLASANYLGYLAGALLCSLQPWLRARIGLRRTVDEIGLVRAGLVATALLTLAMALPAAAWWPGFRFAAGVASAFVFVYSSGWCLAQLARLDATALGGIMYAGPGAGIVVSGLLASALVAWDWRASAGWVLFGVLAAALTAVVWRVFDRGSAPQVGAPGPTAAGTDGAPAPHPTSEVACLAVAYGLAGFGYIISATFLPVIARQALPGSPWLDLFWPILGLGVVVGALLSSRWRLAVDLRPLLAACYLVQAAGIGAGVWLPSVAGFAAGSLLLGLPFTAITFFAMREVRRLRPLAAASTMGALTAMYGIGQIVGPPLAALLVRHAGDAGLGFARSLQTAAAVLVAGAALYLWMARAYPLSRSSLPPGATR